MNFKIEPILFSKELLPHQQPIEIRPSFRTVLIQVDSFTKNKFTLAFPYMQFFIYRNKFMITWAMEPVSSWDDHVSIPMLPNIGVTGNVCMGPMSYEISSLEFCNAFWQSSFKLNEMYSYHDMISDLQETRTTPYSQCELYNLLTWKTLSAKANNPMEVFKGYDDYDFPIRNFLCDIKWDDILEE